MRFAATRSVPRGFHIPFIYKAEFLLDRGADLACRTRQRRACPRLQIVFLLGGRIAGAPPHVEAGDAFDPAVLAADRVVIEQKRMGDFLTAPPLFQKHQGIRTPRQAPCKLLRRGRQTESCAQQNPSNRKPQEISPGSSMSQRIFTAPRKIGSFPCRANPIAAMRSKKSSAARGPQTPHWSRGLSQSRTQPGAEGRQYDAREKARPRRACVRRSKEQHGNRDRPHHRHCSRACKIGLTHLAHNLRRFVFLERMAEVAR